MAESVSRNSYTVIGNSGGANLYKAVVGKKGISELYIWVSGAWSSNLMSTAGIATGIPFDLCTVSIGGTATNIDVRNDVTEAWAEDTSARIIYAGTSGSLRLLNDTAKTGTVYGTGTFKVVFLPDRVIITQEFNLSQGTSPIAYPAWLHMNPSNVDNIYDYATSAGGTYTEPTTPGSSERQVTTGTGPFSIGVRDSGDAVCFLASCKTSTGLGTLALLDQLVTGTENVRLRESISLNTTYRMIIEIVFGTTGSGSFRTAWARNISDDYLSQDPAAWTTGTILTNRATDYDANGRDETEDARCASAAANVATVHLTHDTISGNYDEYHPAFLVSGATGTFKSLETSTDNSNWTTKTAGTDYNDALAANGTDWFVQYLADFNQPLYIRKTWWGLPQIDTASLPNCALGAAYDQTLSASGGAATYSFSKVAGDYPTGISMDSSGHFTGTAQAAGTYNLTIRVTDSQSPAQYSDKALSITVPDVVITTADPLLDGYVGTSYGVLLMATGTTGGLTWTVDSGAAATGLSLVYHSGTNQWYLEGTLGAAGSFTVTLKVTDSAGTPNVRTKVFHQAVYDEPTITSTDPLPAGQIGVAYSHSVTATGGDNGQFSIIAGSLGDLSMDAAGNITGTPLSAATLSFTAKYLDANGHFGTKALSIYIPADLVETPETLANGHVGQAYSADVAATGGTGPFSYAITSGSINDGLTFHSDGTIDGEPTTAGTSSFTVRVTDSQNPADYDDETYSITVYSMPQIVEDSLPDGATDYAYSQTLTTSGGLAPRTIALQSGVLPPGLQLNGVTISGIPTTVGVYPFTLRVIDSATPSAYSDKNLSITIEVGELVVESVDVVVGKTFRTYKSQGGGQVNVKGGVPPYSYSATGLPTGMFINPDTGEIYGVPNQAGTFPYTITINDSAE